MDSDGGELSSPRSFDSMMVISPSESFDSALDLSADRHLIQRKSGSGSSDRLTPTTANGRRTLTDFVKHPNQSRKRFMKGFRAMISGRPSMEDFLPNIIANNQTVIEEHNVLLFDSVDDLNRVKCTIIDLAYALISYGIAAHRLEYYAQMIGLNYGLVCDTWVNPTGLYITFEEAHVKDYDPMDGRVLSQIIPKSNHFVKVRSSGINLIKLNMLEHLAENIVLGKLKIQEARQGVRDIITAAPVYDHFMLLILSRFFSSVMMSIMFNANAAEVLAASIAGLASGFLAILARKYDNFGQVNVICTGIVSGAIAIGFKLLLYRYCYVSDFIVSISGVAPLLPGFGITVAVMELGAGQIISGSCRLVSAFLTSAQIAFGVLVPHKFSSLIPLYMRLLDRDHTPNPLWVKAALLPINITALVISLRAPLEPVSLMFTVVACYCSFFLTNILSVYTGSRMASTYLTSVVVGVISNMFGCISRKHSGIIVCTVGIVLLLPGSLSFRSIQAFLNDDASGAMKFIADVATVATALTVGLLTSNILIPTTKKLRW